MELAQISSSDVVITVGRVEPDAAGLHSSDDLLIDLGVFKVPSEECGQLNAADSLGVKAQSPPLGVLLGVLDIADLDDDRVEADLPIHMRQSAIQKRQNVCKFDL